MAKVTVLVAVYNARKYLASCLNSLLRQTHRDWEAICVDDASTDDSRDILESYARKDGRIRVMAMSCNGGQAKARNAALKLATGEFVCMLDSDDTFSDDALQRALEVFEQHPATDSVLFDLMMCYDDRKESYPLPVFDSLSGTEAFERSLTWNIHGLYMIRTDIHRRFPYDETSHAYSDDNTTRTHFLHSAEVRVCRGIYYYRQHGESVTHKATVRRFDYLDANLNMKKMMLQWQVEDRLIDLYENARWLNLVGVYMFYFHNRRKLPPADSRYGLRKLKEMWLTVEVNRIDAVHRRKFGYCPFRGHWWLFRCQEELYFCLRSILDLFRKGKMH